MKVEELVEWAADLINKVPKDGYDYGKDVARQILSHPDLALIVEKKKYHSTHYVNGVLNIRETYKVIPLAEALREAELDSQ